MELSIIREATEAHQHLHSQVQKCGQGRFLNSLVPTNRHAFLFKMDCNVMIALLKCIALLDHIKIISKYLVPLRKYGPLRKYKDPEEICSSSRKYGLPQEIWFPLNPSLSFWMRECVMTSPSSPKLGDTGNILEVDQATSQHQLQLVRVLETPFHCIVLR